MRLPALAGRGRRIILGGHPAVACVKSMVVDSCGDLYLLDAGKNLIRRLGATDRGIEAPGCKSSPLEKISGIGGCGRGEGGSQPRHVAIPGRSPSAPRAAC